MAGFNRVFLVGNVADEPKLKSTGSGSSVLNIRMASENVSGSRAKNNQKIHKQFFTVVAFGERAEAIAPFITKGKQLTVFGEMQNRSYESKKTGETIWTMEIVAERIIYGEGGEGRPSAPPPAKKEEEPPPSGDDDIPF